MSAVWARLTGAGGTVESGGGLAKRDREWRGVCAGAPFCSSNPDRSTLRLSFATADVGNIPRVRIVVASIKPRTWGRRISFGWQQWTRRALRGAVRGLLFRSCISHQRAFLEILYFNSGKLEPLAF